MGSGFSNPPSILTVKYFPFRSPNSVRLERKSMFLLSGVHPSTILSNPPRGGTTPTELYQVSCLGAPPCDGITKIWRLPEYSPEKAIHLPSGEIFGNSSIPSWEVNLR